MQRTRRPAGSRAHLVISDISGAFDSGRSDISDLKGEIEEWQQNLESNNMEHLPKYEEVTEAYGALEGADDALQGIECPDFLEEVEVQYTIDTRQSAWSRSGRMSNALAALSAAKDGVWAWLEDNEELEANVEDDGVTPTDSELIYTDPQNDDPPFLFDPGTNERYPVVTRGAVDERLALRDAAEEFVNELDSAISEAESVSFPGMY